MKTAFTQYFRIDDPFSYGKESWFHRRSVIIQKPMICIFRADSRFVPSQWEMALLSNNVTHWLGTSLESALILVDVVYHPKLNMFVCWITLSKHKNILAYMLSYFSRWNSSWKTRTHLSCIINTVGAYVLTHLSLGDLDAILKMRYSVLFYWLVPSNFLMIEPHWWLVSIGFGNSLVSSSNKPLPRPVLISSLSSYGRPQWVNDWCEKPWY